MKTTTRTAPETKTRTSRRDESLKVLAAALLAAHGPLSAQNLAAALLRETRTKDGNRHTVEKALSTARAALSTAA